MADGPASRARILVATRGNSLVYSPSDNSLYFVHTVIPAVRRLYQRDGGWFVGPETVEGLQLEQDYGLSLTTILKFFTLGFV